MPKIIALIDADHIVHRAEWKTSFKNSIPKMHEVVSWVLCRTFADDYMMAIKGTNNFRKEIYPAYKQHRNRSKALEHRLEALFQHLIDEFGAVRADEQEADDLVTQWHYQLSKDEEVLPVICSVDKDLLTVTGTHYNIKDDEIYHVDPDISDYNLSLQLLMGDSTDGIPGLPGVGKVKAARMLEGVSMAHRRDRVIQAYVDQFGEDWERELQLTGDLIFIRHIKDESFVI